jgi:hypothetical protein
MGYDKRAKIRPACDMILVSNPPDGYCRKFCFLCGPRVESDYSRVLEPGKVSNAVYRALVRYILTCAASSKGCPRALWLVVRARSGFRRRGSG